MLSSLHGPMHGLIEKRRCIHVHMYYVKVGMVVLTLSAHPQCIYTYGAAAVQKRNVEKKSRWKKDEGWLQEPDCYETRLWPPTHTRGHKAKSPVDTGFGCVEPVQTSMDPS